MGHVGPVGEVVPASHCNVRVTSSTSAFIVCRNVVHPVDNMLCHLVGLHIDCPAVDCVSENTLGLLPDPIRGERNIFLHPETGLSAIRHCFSRHQNQPFMNLLDTPMIVF